MKNGPSVPPELNAIVDVVLAYRPKPKSKAAKRRNRKKKREAKKKEAPTVLVSPDEPVLA
jgi:hypothetical protein